LEGVDEVVVLEAPDLACAAEDFDGVGGASVVGDVLPFPVALFMILENMMRRNSPRRR
jgi:hypothetical protein